MGFFEDTAIILGSQVIINQIKDEIISIYVRKCTVCNNLRRSYSSLEVGFSLSNNYLKTMKYTIC